MIHIFRVGIQFGSGERGLAGALRGGGVSRRSDCVLQQFIDQVDIGQFCVRVRAAQFNLSDVWAAREQDIAHIAGAGRAMAEEFQHIDQVRRVSQDRLAIIAGAVGIGAEECLQVGELRDLGREMLLVNGRNRGGIARCKSLVEATDK